MSLAEPQRRLFPGDNARHPNGARHESFGCAVVGGEIELVRRGFMRMEHRVRSRQAGRFGALDERRVKRLGEASRAARDMALDINTAQLPRLKSLTGIGEHYAKKIVEGRPYRDREELLTRHILPYYIYGRIMERLCASQP